MSITILVILTAVGLVSLRSAQNSYRLNAAQREIVSTFRLAQSYALQGKTQPSGSWSDKPEKKSDGECNIVNSFGCFDPEPDMGVSWVAPDYYLIQFYTDKDSNKNFFAFAAIRRHTAKNLIEKSNPLGIFYDPEGNPYAVEIHQLENGVTLTDMAGKAYDVKGNFIGKVNWVTASIINGNFNFYYTDSDDNITNIDKDGDVYEVTFELKSGSMSKYIKVYKSGLIEESDNE